MIISVTVLKQQSLWFHNWAISLWKMRTPKVQTYPPQPQRHYCIVFIDVMFLWTCSFLYVAILSDLVVKCGRTYSYCSILLPFGPSLTNVGWFSFSVINYALMGRILKLYFFLSTTKIGMKIGTSYFKGKVGGSYIKRSCFCNFVLYRGWYFLQDFDN